MTKKQPRPITLIDRFASRQSTSVLTEADIRKAANILSKEGPPVPSPCVIPAVLWDAASEDERAEYLRIVRLWGFSGVVLATGIEILGSAS